MKAPDKIYIQPNAHDGWFEGNKPNDNFVEYVRKDALLEYIKKELSENQDWRETNPYDRFFGGIEVAYNRVIEKINAL